MHAHPRLKTLGLLVDGLAYAAHETTKLALRSYKESKRRSVGGTIRPGPNTPLWNELAVETRRLIRRHGEKVNLARFLGLPKQRVHEFLMARERRARRRADAHAADLGQREAPRRHTLLGKVT